MESYSYLDFIKTLEKYGRRQALVDAQSGASYSYKELCDVSRKLTTVLAKYELRKGDRLLLYGVSGLNWVPIFLATQLSGVVIVPIDTRANKALVESMIESTDPKIIINDSKIKFGRSSRVHKSQPLIEAAKKLKTAPKLKALDPKSLGQILMTSGTWSQPKGVTLTQANVLENMLATQTLYKPRDKEVLLSILPLSHAYEQMCGLHIPLHYGWKIVYLDEILGDKIKAAAKKYKVSFIVAVPRILDLFQKGILAQIPAAKRGKIISLAKIMRYLPRALRRKVFRRVHEALGPHLEQITIGGAPLQVETDLFFQGLGYKTIIGYGLSETSPIVSISTKQYGRRQGEVGQILDNIEYKVNEAGELLVRGPSVFYGYWPEVRKKKEWFNTGDLVSLQDSQLKLLGRSKNMIVFATGDKVVAEEVELIIDGLDSVEESIVLSKDNQVGSSEGLVIVYKANKDIKKEDIRKTLSQYLPASTRIISMHNVHPEFLERTHTLKLARKKLQDKFISSK